MKNILKKIPGFRTGVIWKMVIAVIGYVYMCLLLLNSRGVTPKDTVINLLTFIIIVGIPFILATNLGNIRFRLPLFKNNTLKSNIMGILVVLLIVSTIIMMLNSFKSPEQRQLEGIESQQNLEDLSE